MSSQLLSSTKMLLTQTVHFLKMMMYEDRAKMLWIRRYVNLG